MPEIHETVLQWVCVEMTKLLGTDYTEDLARYLLSMESSSDLSEYMNDLLDSSQPECKRFITELLKKWQQVHPGSANGKTVVSSQQQLPVHPVALDLPKQTKKGKKKSADSNNSYSSSEGGSTATTPKSGSKKTNYVPLFSSEGQKRTIAMLPGRHPCECQATKHDLVNNCLSCGRVVCQQEGPGPCLFCGKLVCTREQQEILSRNSRKSEKLLNHLMNQPAASQDGAVNEGYEKALQHKNKLLEYDRTSVKRTQVIDDESDYFSTDANQWLKENEKAALRKREEELRSLRHASRKDRKIAYTLDFAGRRVVEEETSVDVYNASDAVVQAANFSVLEEKSDSNFRNDVKDDLVNPCISIPAPKFISEDSGKQKKSTAKSSQPDANTKHRTRIQDGDLEQLSDSGMALSMHQPWASLLVAGIKRHEGRTWYTPHRGILWIASTAKEPSREEIAQVEDEYRVLYNDKNIQFPKCYPVGSLLGCVEVTDCVAQEDYVEKYPGGESGSPYVFICEDPRELLVKFPMKGKHKIYKLDGHLHKAAKKGIIGLRG